mmetsp:Transcript_68649/g.200914  ORF Transcript_68649/g.200914 Transcript_68649/m.200914 type:complete len:231 (+) Transcript_68649:89-781(+)
MSQVPSQLITDCVGYVRQSSLRFMPPSCRSFAFPQVRGEDHPDVQTWDVSALMEMPKSLSVLPSSREPCIWVCSGTRGTARNCSPMPTPCLVPCRLESCAANTGHLSLHRNDCGHRARGTLPCSPSLHRRKGTCIELLHYTCWVSAGLGLHTATKWFRKLGTPSQEAMSPLCKRPAAEHSTSGISPLPLQLFQRRQRQMNPRSRTGHHQACLRWLRDSAASASQTMGRDP